MGMEPFVAADDNAFGHLIGSIPDPVKNLREAIAFKVGLDREKAQTADLQAEAQEKAQEVSRAQMFQNDLQAVQKNPDARAISALIMKYPEFADKIKTGWDVKEKATKDADLTQLGEVYSAAASGNWHLAMKQALARWNADKAAGLDDSADQAFMEQLIKANDGDTEAQKAVMTSIGIHLAAAAGPEHFATVYGAVKGGFTLDAGATRYDENGHVVAQSPFMKGNDGAIFERDGAHGTPVTPAKPDTTPGGDDGFDSAVAFTLKHEGGYNPHDMNGAPVNFGINQTANPGVDVAHMTQDEAKGIYKTKYWNESGAANLPKVMQTPYFDTYVINPERARQFLKKSDGDPNKFMAMREAWLGSVAAKHPQYAKAYATRNADLRLTMAGTDAGKPYYSADGSGADAAPPGYHTLIPGKQPEQFENVTGDKAKTLGLDPDFIWKVNSRTKEATKLGEASPDDALDGNPNLTGSAYFNSLPKAKQGIVKSIIDGAFPITSKMTSPSVIKLFEEAARVDPTVDASTYQRRVATQRDFASSGKSGQAIASARTIINHLYNLAQESEKIGGINWKFGNSVLNMVKGQASDPDLKGYMATLTPLSNELPKFLGGKAPTIHEIQQTREDFSPDAGPDARRKQISTTMELMQGRFDPLVQSYTQGMNRNADITDLISSVTGDKAAAAKLRALQNYAAGGRLEPPGSSDRASGKTVVRTGRDKTGRRVVQYSDGSIGYAP